MLLQLKTLINTKVFINLQVLITQWSRMIIFPSQRPTSYFNIGCPITRTLLISYEKNLDDVGTSTFSLTTNYNNVTTPDYVYSRLKLSPRSKIYFKRVNLTKKGWRLILSFIPMSLFYILSHWFNFYPSTSPYVLMSYVGYKNKSYNSLVTR